MYKILIFLLFYTLFFILTEIECRDNHEINLNCWPVKLKYKSFDINITLSTRTRIDQVIGSNTSFSPLNIGFDPKRKTIVITHGLAISNEHINELEDLRDALLKWDDVNVVSMDWYKGCSNALLYFQAVVNTKYAAYTLKDVLSYTIKLWKEENKFNDDWVPQLHLVGFSLGAHVVGQTAELLKIEDNLLVNRITGLDPAGPCFNPTNFKLRLSSNNAHFVDVIHTDGALSQNEAFGLYDPIGHADFYVNGGRKQPGCGFLASQKSVPSLLKLLVHAMENGICSHRRGFKIFLESVIQAISKNCKFSAYPWILRSPFRIHIKKNDKNWPEMGINADLYNYKVSSTFYVPTTSKSPFCNIQSDN
ncbi:PREDICTED: lipase member I-like [Ceratosolen solmsi marchali]|uniref:phospholipase A1 n=1 Tax=Ceratosolen solmsi marchali TaxID=326594 RepID=A0AAJ6VKF5_9HYME|nr:PREDICTED: lipase member I-like [Ceratosolen solmsi marchali]